MKRLYVATSLVFLSIFFSTLVAAQTNVSAQSITSESEDIVIDANFDSGSIHSYSVNGNTIDISLNTEHIGNTGANYTYWTNFKVFNVLNLEITFNITGIDVVPFLAHQGIEENQMVYSCDGETWNRLTQNSYSNENNGTYTFTETFLCDEVQIAMFFPFSYQRMHDYVDMVRQSQWATATVLGSSLQGRDIDLLTITNTSIPVQDKEQVYIIGRQHAAETASSHMLKGMIDFLISDDPDAQIMKDNFEWYIVPMVNPDGVYEGNSRATSELRDPNRDWDNNVTDAINIVRENIELIDNAHAIDLFFDWHNQMNDVGWYNFIYSPPGNTFFTILSDWTDFDQEKTPGTSCSSQSCSARGYATLRLGLFTFVFEPTPHLYTWTLESLKQQGINTAYAITEYFGVSLPDTDSPTPNPMTWMILPNPTGSNSISMTATNASDENGIEYYFQCTAGTCSDSGWQDSSNYEDIGLQPETQYTYRVKARDTSPNQNETEWSSSASATTESLDPCNYNGSCEFGEECNNCPNDCISGGGGDPGCGNGICEPGIGEDCLSCRADCSGKQKGKLSKQFCCGDGDGINPVGCGDPRCNSGEYNCGSISQLYCCGDSVCEGLETSNNCVIDCGSAPFCGDGTCDSDEDECSCSTDCGIPPGNEAICDDGIDNDCDGHTDCEDKNCESDIACQAPCNGDGVCDPGEDCNTCPGDCAGNKKGKPSSRYCCGNGVVENPEGDGSICDGNY